MNERTNEQMKNTVSVTKGYRIRMSPRHRRGWWRRSRTRRS